MVLLTSKCVMLELNNLATTVLQKLMNVGDIHMYTYTNICK